MNDHEEEQDRRGRLLRFLRRGSASVSKGAARNTLILDAGDGRRMATTTSTVDQMLALRLVTVSGRRMMLTAHGRDLARDHADVLAAARLQLETAVVQTADGPAHLFVNMAESPLASLWRRKTRDGSRYLSEAEFRAGERLRADYDRGRIMPRLGVNWSAAGASAAPSGSAGGQAELTAAAISARQRVERAIEAVGPELAGVLVDVCCFLKGLELVETERGWPVRSAKVVLKTALAVLVRHYDPGALARSRSRPTTLHWGTPDYRPTTATQAGRDVSGGGGRG